ncbi:phosphatidylinositol glycan, class O [Fistulifera solaris]|uniref:Phosphatidylinositol glycan, class O n=1 Tax=Fistulifera solaris TaxID=1519565 RepID=A0A1Z5K0W5_FISSO|nr:phosphatidylinositol glycan, class O [Fistulifera solaris]|eukprot:GAX19943.1 phosphatidylinositol glycan, class O [Fistulifera solaris]
MGDRKRRYYDLCWICLCLFGLYWFTASFFLAKRSLAERSSCDEAATLLTEVLGLTLEEVRGLESSRILSSTLQQRNGCWMDRKIDSLVVLVVDALRFDFAYYNLPKSVGRRLKPELQFREGSNRTQAKARLFQFVADPPTVTMQRLKALTTGGLPTFADISANMGGATVEEDSWMHQVVTIDGRNRGLSAHRARMGFVGDDTWEDLFPGFFAESYPYPSFNTRDLDTVDNGCLKHIPDMLSRLRTRASVTEDLEVIVVHFLGVDHVGHTFGPHNQHMDAKLKEMDDALSKILDRLDESNSCHTTFIFGDHGMTEDGNHGGGTAEETHAALFVHSSPVCADSVKWDQLEETLSVSELVKEAQFSSIHQIDLVSTISMTLGLPIPYANLGSFVPALVPGEDVRKTTAALALNSAQIWRYFNVYSATANRLPGLDDLALKLETAVDLYKDALREDKEAGISVEAFLRASSHFKVFLKDCLDLGQRVWTRFDTFGMTTGILLLSVTLVAFCVPLLCSKKGRLRASVKTPASQYWEIIAAMVLIVYQCGLLTFSNSYILEEQQSLGFSISVLCSMIAFRLWSDRVATVPWQAVLFIPLSVRCHSSLVTGHGMDASIPLHISHHPFVFLTSLSGLLFFRRFLFHKQFTGSSVHAAIDCLALLLTAWSWCEKRLSDSDVNGFLPCRLAFLLLIPSLFLVAINALMKDKFTEDEVQTDGLTALFKFLILVMLVTGPSAAASLILYSVQCSIVYALSLASGAFEVNSFVLAVLVKLITRHTFFSTNHGCAFNRLQLSAAFVATKEFNYIFAGTSLFLNTFGWEIAGLVFTWLLNKHRGRQAIWRFILIFQVVEALCSCISVSVLRRHLMVWDIYAPHFLFSAIFSILNLLSQLSVYFLSAV